MTIPAQTTDELSIAAIRLLSIDMIAKAKSGHPGECHTCPCFSEPTFCTSSSKQVLPWEWLLPRTSSYPAIWSPTLPTTDGSTATGWSCRTDMRECPIARLTLSSYPFPSSALLYSLLHISGYNLSIDDLKGFRQLGSKTPGHPESFKTEGGYDVLGCC